MSISQTLTRPFARLSFQAKINLGIAAIVVIFGFVSALLVSRSASLSLLEETKKRGANMALALSSRAVDQLLTMDFLRMKNAADQTRSLSESVLYAFVQDKSGQVLVHTFGAEGFPMDLQDANAPSGPGADGVSTVLLDTGEGFVHDFAAPVSIDNTIIGTVRIGLSRDEIDATAFRLLQVIFAITGAASAFAVALGSIFARTVTRRINLLRASAEEIVRGNLEIQTARPVLKNCWETLDCTLTECPAFGNRLHRCWYLAGTLCHDPRAHMEPGQSCRDCHVYQENAGDELQSLAEAFDAMSLALSNHIDELREKEEVVSRQKQLLKTILDVTPDLVSLQDESLVYKAVNKAFCTFFHVNEEDILGRDDSALFSADQALSNPREDARIIETGRPMSKQTLVSRGNNRRWFHIIKVPVSDSGRTIGLLLTARDITVLKQYQEQLIQSQKMEDLGKLAGGVAHEINTPLGIILGYSQLLMEDFPEGSQTREDLSTIERQAKVCRKIVADLLGFSRSIDSARAEMDLNRSLEEVVSLVDNIFRQERVLVDTDLDPTVPAIIGDRDKLRQVWINLLNNAFDAIGSDGTIFVRTKLCENRRRVVISVADTGSGISQENLSRIFDPFFSTKPVGSGTGLGLSVSFGIIKDHNGRISAVSPAPVDYLHSDEDKTLVRPPGPGTVFFVELPLDGGELPEEECVEITRARGEGVSQGEEGAAV